MYYSLTIPLSNNIATLCECTHFSRDFWMTGIRDFALFSTLPTHPNWKTRGVPWHTGAIDPRANGYTH